MTGTDANGPGASHDGSDGAADDAAGSPASTGSAESTRSSPGGGTSTHAPRRTFLKAVGASAVAGTFLATTGNVAGASGEFVEAEGTNFVVDGQPVYFSGANNFWITDAYAQRSKVDNVMDVFADVGVNLLRTWTFCEGDSGGHCMQPEAGVHNEAALEHLDYVVAKAKQHGIRLVLTFVDNWDHDGGMDQYVSWSDTAEYHGDFYTDDQCREWYRNHVETIVTRENSITGVEYREEPAIAMWELANEPRIEGDAFGEGSDPGYEERAQTLENWFSDMGSFVKELDPNHLISSGTEGFYTRDGASEWFYSDWTGQDYVRHHSVDEIDVCSFHMYPYHWDFPDDGSPFPLSYGVDWIAEHVQDAHEQVGKPAYLGEFNVNAQEHDLQTRNSHLQDWYDELDANDGDAVTIWQLVTEDQDDHDGFQVYASESGDILSGYADRAEAKSGGGQPVVDALAPSSVRMGESAHFNGVYSFAPNGSIASYEWDFGDGATGSGESAYHRYDATGTYDAQLTATDSSGTSGTDAETVTVEGIPEDSYVVEGAGETLHNDVKEFHFGYVPISGDFTVEAKVATMASTDPEAQAGILVTDDPSSPGPLGAATVTPGNGTEQTRAYQDTTWRERSNDGRSPPLWVRLERSGGTVSTSVSADGSSWSQINEGQVDMPTDAYVGLFVSSNSPGDLCTVQFDGVTWLDGFEATDVGAVEAAGATTAGTGETGVGDTPTPEPDTPTPTPDDGCPEGEDAPTQVDGVYPQDLDGDGLHRDLNANCRLDSDDVVTYFDNMDSAPIQDNVGSYDYNENGRIDFDDVVTLFESL